MSRHTHHEIDYIELSATDLETTAEFYRSAFGWTTVGYGPDYVGIEGEQHEQGGIARGDAPPLVQLYSGDLDATLAAVEAAGGVVEVPPYAFPGGRRFAFRDPAGNVLGVWSET